MSLARRYTQAQREALVAAYRRPGVTARRVAAQAAAGAVEHPNGHVLAPFTAPENTIRSLARREAMREQAAAARAELVELRPLDAVEVCRRRLLLAIDARLTREECQIADGGRVDMVALIRVTRATRELAALSQGLHGPPAPAPGPSNGTRRNGSATHGTLAAKALRALREGGRGVVEDGSVPAPHEPAEPAPTHVDPRSLLEQQLHRELYGDGA
jgi:hypothetical protein